MRLRIFFLTRQYAATTSEQQKDDKDQELHCRVIMQTNMSNNSQDN